MLPRKRFAHLPTPLWHSNALDRLVGTEVWVKRDDMTAGAEAGNKIRKLEYLLGDAAAIGATTVITCGGLQSNHARATALLCRQLGMRPLLFLRTTDPSVGAPLTGNVLLDKLVGAEIRLITPSEYREREVLMRRANQELEAQGERPYVIPEGGSNGRGALGYALAMREVREQLNLGLGGGPRPFDAVVHACGSGGTAAGIVLGAEYHGVAPRCCAMAVCDDRDYFTTIIGRIVEEARSLEPELCRDAKLEVYDEWKGPAYAEASHEQKLFIAEVAERTGLALDPVYTGKALFGLSKLEPKPACVLFLHTGGLPGLLAQGEDFTGLV